MKLFIFFKQHNELYLLNFLFSISHMILIFDLICGIGIKKSRRVCLDFSYFFSIVESLLLGLIRRLKITIATLITITVTLEDRKSPLLH